MISYWQNTSTEAPATSEPRPAARKGRLGRKLVVQILVLNALLSVLASSAQLYASYLRDRTSVLQTVETIDRGFRSGFETALWNYNFPVVEALLEGVISKPDVQFLSLTTDQGRTWTLGDRKEGRAPSESLEFSRIDTAGNRVAVGTLVIELTFRHVDARVWSHLWTLLLSNFAKTFCASALLLMLFERNIGHHMRKIASRVSQFSWTDTPERLVLDRAPTAVADDLDHIVAAINLAKGRREAAMGALEAEVIARRTVEADLRQRTDALELANREQAQFTYAISHDLKSPVNTIAMLLEELEHTEADRLCADNKEVLGDARQTVLRMTRLIDDILGYARTIDEGMITETVDLTELVGEIVEDLRSDIVTANADIQTTDLTCVEGNRTQLRMLFQNLIANAIKFRAPDRPPIVTLALHASADPKCVKIVVSDNGIGIAPEYHEKVFALFQRLHSHAEYVGSGLGLTLCKRIVMNHSGHISLSSAAAQGTTVDIVLPKENHGK